MTPDLLIVWDTSLITPEQYAELVAALGDLVRAEGGLGLERVTSRVAAVDVGRQSGYDDR